MSCDVCSKPSTGPRCPMCRHTFGDAPIPSRVVRVEPPTRTQRRADNEHGWEPEGS